MKPMKRMRAGVLALCALAAAQAAPPLLELSLGLHRLEAEVADTPALRRTGLMYRKTLAPNQGMLFVFPEADEHCMWMRNTYVPLSVAFLDERGVVINIEDMEPETETTHCAKRAARYALEVNRGWFLHNRLGAGTRVGGLDARRH